MSDNNFAILYKTWATEMLLDVIDNPSDYQPFAVEAAQLELDSRQLTQEQMAEAKAKQDLRRQDKAKQQRVEDIENKVKSFAFSLADTFNPIQKETPITDKLIKIISLFIGGIFLYQLYTGFGMFIFMFTDDGAEWNFSMVLYFLTFIILPVIGFLFWFRKKIGWILAAIYFSYTAAGAIPMFIIGPNRRLTNMSELDILFPAISPIVYIWTFLFFGGLTCALCQKNMREVYHVDKKSMFIALGIGIDITLLIILLVL